MESLHQVSVKLRICVMTFPLKMNGDIVFYFLKFRISTAAGLLQLCTGQLSGNEAAAHSMRQMYSSSDVEEIILVDTSNAFNSLN